MSNDNAPQCCAPPVQTSPSPNTIAELENRFTYHAPKNDQPERYEALRAAHLQLAKFIVRNTPSSPEQKRAIEKIDESMMLANAAIARRE